MDLTNAVVVILCIVFVTPGDLFHDRPVCHAPFLYRYRHPILVYPGHADHDGQRHGGDSD